MLRPTALKFFCFTLITRATKNPKSAAIKTFTRYLRELHLGDSAQTHSTRHSKKTFWTKKRENMALVENELLQIMNVFKYTQLR